MRRYMEEDAIREAVMILTSFNPRPGQISSLRSLVIRGQGCVLKAKTSYGKSVATILLPLHPLNTHLRRDPKFQALETYDGGH